jgi:methionyl-tRNA formyltransferase
VLRVVFAGTPAFAARALEAIIAQGDGVEVVGVYTQPDRPAGRGQKLSASAVKQSALAHCLTVLQPPSLRDAAAQATLAALKPDLIIVAAYGLILPQAVLDIPRLGCLNIHGSLLPRWRGAAPIQRCIEAGDTETGVCIMRMEAGLDTGPVLHEVRTPISPMDTAGSVHDRLAELGAQAMLHVLQQLARGARMDERPQPTEGVTYAHKITPEHARIDWAKPASELDRMIRAFNPVPGCSAMLAGELVKVWQATPVASAARHPGEVFDTPDDALCVACGDGALSIQALQRPGGKRITAQVYCAGRSQARS